MTRLTIGAVIFAAAGLVATGAPAADKDAPKFAAEVASGDMMEARLGELAAMKAKNPQVKAFGKWMVREHAKTNQELKAEAQRAGIPLPTEMSARHQKLVDELANKTGAEFDRAYMKAMVADHEAEVKKFQNHAKDQDSPLQSFAEKTLPVLESQLTKAKEVRAGLG